MMQRLPVPLGASLFLLSVVPDITTPADLAAKLAINGGDFLVGRIFQSSNQQVKARKIQPAPSRDHLA
jgi:hypothetical protein